MQKKFLLIIITIVIGHYAHSQGCSDAGVCTMPGIKQTPTSQAVVDTFNNKMGVGISLGTGDDDNTIVTLQINYVRTLSPKNTLAVRATAAHIKGNKGTNTGAGDVYFIYNRTIKNTDQQKAGLTFGIKLPLDNADATPTKPLPLSYQTSLGTYDAIAGINYRNKMVDASAAVQYPLHHVNNNSYYAFNTDTIIFQSTNQFVRSADAILRLAWYKQFMKNKFGISAGVLNIYHVANDTYKNMKGEVVTLQQSQGLTVNIVLNGDYHFSPSSHVSIDIASPVVVRKIRPDGLTRKWVLALAYINYF